ncbi:unnamed protein product [Miscanthus lutarioriparius]|uniref:Uncharacterized protein n=1 Tax=Miscanthus lutarioriparius TaxID=422564 RepID=A0A811R1G2_9POAL|nr:unnamed protein product [Miscanthus lutarioriparius]
MAEAADTAPAQQQQAARVVSTTTTTASDVSASAWLQQVLALLFPSNLAAKAALFALVVVLPLLPSGQAEAPRIWELPHLLLLGIIISYGVFGQKNADAAEVAAAAAGAAADDTKLLPVVDNEAAVEAYVSQMMQGSLVFEENDDDGASKDGGGVQQAWSSQYLPDDPLVVVADTSAPGTNSGNDVITDTGEKPLLLPVRKLKPAGEESAAAATPEPAGDMMSDGSGIEEEEEEEELLLAPKSGTGYDVVRDHAIPSPSSVLDADLTLSPSSPPLLPPPPPPPPPPFLGRRGRRSSLLKAKARSFNEFGTLSSNRSPNGSLGSHSATRAGNKQFRSRSAVQATRSTFGRRYDPVVPIDDEADDETLSLGEMAAASDSSFSSDLDDDDTIKEENSCEDNGVDEDGDGNSCDEELFELATRPGPEGETETEMEEVEDEVDRKADEFIAKFREQIRMQRVEPARR